MFREPARERLELDPRTSTPTEVEKAPVSWVRYEARAPYFQEAMFGLQDLAAVRGALKGTWFQTLMHIAATSVWILPVIRAGASWLADCDFFLRADGPDDYLRALDGFDTAQHALGPLVGQADQRGLPQPAISSPSAILRRSIWAPQRPSFSSSRS